jgi:hypothetical protein
MATVKVTQAELVLNTFAAIFQNNLVSADLATWKKFDGEMNDRNGLEVVEQVTPDYSTTFTANAVQDLTPGVQDTIFGSERFKLDQVITTSMGWADFVKIRDINDARESEAVKAAALRMAHDIDAYVLRHCALASNNLLGDGVSPVATWDDVAGGYTRLKEEGCEDNSGLRAVLTYGDWQALGSDVVQTNGDKMGNIGEGVYREGWQGKIAGIPTTFTQQLPSFTVGTRTQASALTAGTAESATTYDQVCESAAPGQFMTQLLTIDIGSGTETVLDGEVFTITGVFAYDNRAKKALNHLQQFRVVGNAAAVGGIASVRVYPALITSGPFQTIAQAPANTAVVNFVGAPGATLQPRFICDKSAVVVNTADLIMPATGTARRMSLTKVPLSVRMWTDSRFETGEHRVRFDVAIRANTTAHGRRRSVRING